MAGWTTNGMPPVGPLVGNGTTVSPAPLTNLTSAALIPMDTETSAGAQPQSGAVTGPQIASFAASLIYNSATSTANAATLARNAGVVLTEALTTAVNATYTMTVTNSLVATTDPVIQVQMHDVTNTAGAVQVDSITNGSGSFVAVFRNIGTAAWNGTKAITFHR